MNKALLSSVALVALINSAIAADLPSRKAPILAIQPTWSGFYAGLNAGYSFGTNNNISSSYTGTANLSSSPSSNIQYSIPFGQSLSGVFGNNQNGFMGGAQFGYNYQYGKNIILGLETDISGSSVRGGSTLNGYSFLNTGNDNSNQANEINVYGNSVVNAGVDYLGTVRARLGYLFTPNILLYGTGGFSYGGAYANTFQNSSSLNTGVSSTSRITFAQQVAGYNQTSPLLVGWNAGAGIEWMFLPNWSLKTEAIYWNLGSANIVNNTFGTPNKVSFELPGYPFTYPAYTYGNTRINYQGVVIRSGINYHFNGDEINSLDLASSVFSPKGSSLSLKDSDTPISWAGLYAGISAGYNFGTNTSTTISSFGTNAYPLVRDSVTDAASNGQGAAPFGLALSGITGNNQNGYVGGAQVGYNYQFNQKIILGVETDISGSSLRSGNSTTGAANSFAGPDNVPRTYNFVATGWSSINSGVDYIGTLRGRIGYLLTPKLLTYGTAGFSYGGVYGNVSQSATSSIYVVRVTSGAHEVNYQNISGYGQTNQLLVGWNAGGGFEWMFSPNWSLKTEAIYWNLGNANVQSLVKGPAINYGGSLTRGSFTEVPPYATTTTKINYQGVIARAGVNYHFNFDSLPIVAKY